MMSAIFCRARLLIARKLFASFGELPDEGAVGSVQPSNLLRCVTSPSSLSLPV